MVGERRFELPASWFRKNTELLTRVAEILKIKRLSHIKAFFHHKSIIGVMDFSGFLGGAISQGKKQVRNPWAPYR